MLGAMVLMAVLELPFAASAGDSKLEHARQVSLAYAASMPSYVADETAKRYTSNSPSGRWQVQDTIQTEITINGARAVRRQVRRNGKPWERPFEELPGFKWYGGFGTEIRPVFAPGCSTTLDPQRFVTINGKRLLKIRFSAPAGGCFAFLYLDNRQANPPRSGHVLIDDATGNVMQYDEEAAGFPADFGMTQRNEEVTWANVTIGDSPHLLPMTASFLVRYASGAQARIEVEYRNHRHFEASSTIAFPKGR
jgi:hypothetical protein